MPKININVELEIPDNLSPREVSQMVAEIILSTSELHAMVPNVTIAKDVSQMVAYIERVTGQPYKATR